MSKDPTGSPELPSRIHALQRLLDAGADPNQRDALGRTLVHLAAEAGDVEAMKCLLGAGGDVNARDAFGNTPLMLAVNPGATYSALSNTAFGFISQLCTQTWQQLGAAHKVGMPYGEETITDNLCLALKTADLAGVQVYKVSKSKEAKTGVDIELYVGNDSNGWWVYLIQAKRVEVVREWYRHLLHTRASDGKYQFDLLEEHAKAKKAIPLYAFYNYVSSAKRGEHYHCKFDSGLPVLGWTLATTKTVRPFIASKTKPTFDDMHRPQGTLPARCLLCSRVVNAQQATDHPLAGDFVGAVRAATLPGHVTSQTSVTDSAGLLLGDWVVVIDTSQAFLAPCDQLE